MFKSRSGSNSGWAHGENVELQPGGRANSINHIVFVSEVRLGKYNCGVKLQ